MLAITAGPAILTLPSLWHLGLALAAEWNEHFLRCKVRLKRSLRDFIGDLESGIDVDAVVDATVNTRFPGLLRHRPVQTTLVRKLRIEHAADGSGDAGMIARVGGMIGHANRKRDLGICLRRPRNPVDVFGFMTRKIRIESSHMHRGQHARRFRFAQSMLCDRTACYSVPRTSIE